MPKVNLLALPRPVRREKTVTVTDPQQPGFSLTITLRALDAAGQIIAMERAEAFAAEYATNWFPMPNDSPPVQITERIAQNLCILEAMQVGEEEERYTAADLVGLLVNAPAAFASLAAVVGELSEPEPAALVEGALGNSAGVGGSKS